MARKIIIGSRGSDLALWQANYTQSRLRKNGIESEIKIIKTTGDKIQHLSFDKMEGKGFFTKEIEESLLKKDIDLAVHSHKDLESTSPPGLTIGGISEREDPSELLLIRKEAYDPSRELSLKKNAVVGTSSSRRKAQLLSLQPEVQIKDIRGNVPTRIDKLRRGDFDSILLAYAGVKRLGVIINDLVAIRLDPHIFVPAPAQGVLAFQCREDDSEVLAALKRISSLDTAHPISVEREVLKKLGGGCQMPFGIHCIHTGEKIAGEAVLASSWNSFPKRIHFEASIHQLETNSILKKLQSTISGPVLITRSLAPDSYLKRYCAAHGAELIDSPFISISPLPFEDKLDTEWVFFGSPNSVRHYLGQGGEIAGRKIGAYGIGTAKLLERSGTPPDFIGHSSDSSIVASDFKKTVGQAKVLFPSSNITLKNIPNALNPEQVVSLIAYQTELVPKKIDRKITTGIFTSPSNVEAFFNKNAKEAVVHYIALGSVTAKALRNAGIEPTVAYLPTEFALASML